MKWQLNGRAENIEAVAKRGTVLDGVLFSSSTLSTPIVNGTSSDEKSAAVDERSRTDTVVIAITGIHGNFYSNPFYFNFGNTLNGAGIDFVYAQVCDAFGEINTRNVLTGKAEVIGSWNERFSYADEDIAAYIDWAENAGYRHIVLAGHSLGANKVIHYLANTHDSRIDRFLLLSPCNVEYLTSLVTEEEKQTVRKMCENGHGDERLPFDLLGWIPCIADTAHDWLFSDTLNNVHVEAGRDFSQVENVTHTGALLIGTRDNFTYGDPAGYLQNINEYFPTAVQNKLIYIEGTGHTYQQKEQETAERILECVKKWQGEWKDGMTFTR
ncbi:MAG: DUF1749 domain-containing protein [Treponema sp.]|nr:DUF1749 domain-containing protein [Treponema sp.]